MGNSSAAILLVLAFAAAAVASSSATVRVPSDDGSGGEGLLSYHHVHVSNGLTGGKELLLHCKSKDDDLGIHNLTAGSEFKWQFKLMVQVGTTLYWCYLAPDDSHHASFDAFNGDHYQDHEFKSHTYWIGKDDGVYVRLVDKNVDSLVYHWDDGRPNEPGPNMLS